METTLKELMALIDNARQLFAQRLQAAAVIGPTSLEQYVRYLSFQYHLTRGVQRYFITAAAHPDLAKRKKLRAFLVNFANEEELHYLVAANDLRKLGQDPLPEPFDVTLWHAYFRSVVADRPFIRLGAACILENISAGPAHEPVQRALSAPFLNRENTKFLVLHQHETLPHGDQIVDALEQANLDVGQIADLLDGARRGTVLYLRMVDWSINPQSLASLADGRVADLGGLERSAIDSFQMAELETPATDAALAAH